MTVLQLANAPLLAVAAAETAAPTVELDPISLITNASGLVFVVVWVLIVAAVSVWFIAVLKLMQLARWKRAEKLFEQESTHSKDVEGLFAVAARHPGSAGARVVLEMQKQRDTPARVEAAGKRALVEEQRRASTMMSFLGSIGSAGPFIGLLGTVWGIMDAFLRIGREKTASLPVVAPAIGEALIATAIGLLAAIPAVIAYNAISRRLDDMLLGMEASSEGHAKLIAQVAAEPDWRKATITKAESDRALLLTRPQPGMTPSPPAKLPPTIPGTNTPRRP